jgi:hypothetical protein
VAFSAFLPEVAPLVQGCPDVVTETAIRNAAIEFCTKTNVWQATQDAETITAADLPYTLNGPAGAMVTQVQSLKVNGIPLDPVTIDYLDNTFLNWEVATGQPRFYYLPNTAEFSLYPLPQSDIELRLRLAYAPLRSANSIDRAIFDNNLPTIAAGALARLLLMPLVSWTNPQLAAYYKSLFDTATTDVQSDTQKSFGRARNRVRINAF